MAGAGHPDQPQIGLTVHSGAQDRVVGSDQAQTYHDEKPIPLVVLYAPRGAVDVVARLLSVVLGQELKTSAYPVDAGGDRKACRLLTPDPEPDGVASRLLHIRESPSIGRVVTVLGRKYLVRSLTAGRRGLSARTLGRPKGGPKRSRRSVFGLSTTYRLCQIERVIPPSTRMFCPVMYAAPSDTRNAMVAAISSLLP